MDKETIEIIIKMHEIEIAFLRDTNRELSNMVGVVEDRIQLIKRKMNKMIQTQGGKT
ncbi:hypothetical protein LCGC14_1241470 [marine sediment metagenome]|uniref:Uncharacterized protein n=1 Tax=marine sediment metagenome TaxID=412755 RepID=A0A0F9L5M2_9ZZZZ